MSCIFESCEVTVNNCSGGSPQTCTPGTGGTETCNGIDDDCDASTDEGLGVTTCGSGSACEVTVNNCSDGSSQTCYAGQVERCSDNVDDDCDGSTDESSSCATTERCGNSVDDDFDGSTDEGSCANTEYCEGDFNGDGDVDDDDLDIFRTEYFLRLWFSNPCTDADPCYGDFNCDTSVNNIDLTTVFNKDYERTDCPDRMPGRWCNY